MRHELTITQKSIGTETASGSVASFETDISRKIPSLTADIMPVQDLNGYDKPWPGGGGKNLLNANQGAGSVSGVTFTNDDGVITASGTASANVYRLCGKFYAESGVQYILNGCPSGGANGKFRITMSGFGYDYGDGYTFTGDGAEHNVSIDIYPGAGNVNLTFKPMIRLATETDPTFEPYSNICPITGWTGVNVTRVGKNLVNPNDIIKGYYENVTWTIRESGSRVFRGLKIWLLAGTYYVSFAKAVNIVRFTRDGRTQSNSHTNVTGFAFSTTSDGFVGISWRDTTSSSTAWDDTTPIQLEAGSVATDYEPYQGETYSVTFPTAAGTVYGGYVDVTKGKLVVDWNTETLVWGNGYAVTDLNGITRKIFSLQQVGDASKKQISITDIAPFSGTEWDVSKVHFDVGGTNNKQAFVWLPTETDPETTITLARPIATPIIYDLTPEEISTLLGQNNIWADTGEVAVKYSKLIEAIEHKLTIRKAEN